jgi:colanic acid/amylovoran biosynthesis protein
MKVTIVNCYHDSNKGSSAILWGLIRRLKGTGVVNSISLVSMFQKAHPLYESSLRHIKAEFPEVVVTGAPLPSSHNKHKKIGDMRSPYARLFSVANAAIRLKRLKRVNASLDEACHEIATSDLVLDRGGPFFAGDNRFLNLTLYNNAYPLLVARKFGVPMGFAPGTFGPFASNWGKRFVKKLCEDAAVIMVREPISKDVLVGCDVDANRIVPTVDSAFWVEARQSQRIDRIMRFHSLERGQFIAVTTREWHADRKKKYHEGLAATIDKLVPDYFKKVVLVANMVDPAGHMGDDRRATTELYQLIEKKEYVSVLDEDFAPDELVGLYGQARLVLGTRLHSVIMALAAGTPAVAVSYVGHKTKGVMQAVGFAQYVMELDTFSRESALPLVLSALATDGQVADRIRELRQQGNAVFNASIQRVAAGALMSSRTPPTADRPGHIKAAKQVGC